MLKNRRIEDAISQSKERNSVGAVGLQTARAWPPWFESVVRSFAKALRNAIVN
jgi:hypothetical protein